MASTTGVGRTLLARFVSPLQLGLEEINRLAASLHRKVNYSVELY